MSTKKWLQTFEIWCPIFQGISEGGRINYNNPFGCLFYLSPNVKLWYKKIWKADNKVLFFIERVIRVLINIILTMLLLPATAVIWLITQLIFAINYDKKEERKGNKSYLFVIYTSIICIIVGLGFMYMQYKTEPVVPNVIHSEPVRRSDTVRKAKTTPTAEPITAEVVEEQIEDKGYVLKRTSR